MRTPMHTHLSTAAFLKAGFAIRRCALHTSPSDTNSPLPVRLLPGKKAVPAWACRHKQGSTRAAQRSRGTRWELVKEAGWTLDVACQAATGENKLSACRNGAQQMQLQQERLFRTTEQLKRRDGLPTCCSLAAALTLDLFAHCRLWSLQQATTTVFSDQIGPKSGLQQLSNRWAVHHRLFNFQLLVGSTNSAPKAVQLPAQL